MINKEVFHLTFVPLGAVGFDESNPLQSHPAPVERDKEDECAVHEEVGNRLIRRGSVSNPQTNKNSEDVMDCQRHTSGRIAHADQGAEEQHLAEHTGQLDQDRSSFKQADQNNAMNDIGFVTEVDDDPCRGRTNVMLEVGCTPDVRRVHQEVAT